MIFNFNDLTNQQLRDEITRARMLRELQELNRDQRDRDRAERERGSHIGLIVVGMIIMGLIQISFHSPSSPYNHLVETSTVEVR